MRKSELVTIRLTPESRKILDQASRETGKTVSEIIRRVLADHYDIPVNRVEFSVTERGSKHG